MLGLSLVSALLAAVTRGKRIDRGEEERRVQLLRCAKGERPEDYIAADAESAGSPIRGDWRICAAVSGKLGRWRQPPREFDGTTRDQLVKCPVFSVTLLLESVPSTGAASKDVKSHLRDATDRSRLVPGEWDQEADQEFGATRPTPVTTSIFLRKK